MYILCSFESACNDLRILINCKFVDVTFIDKNILFQRPRANTSTRKLLVTLCENNTIVYFRLAFETFYFYLAKDNSFIRSCTPILTVGSKYVLVVKEMKLYCPERQLRTKKARGENQERKTDKGRKRQINKKKPYGTINAEV